MVHDAMHRTCPEVVSRGTLDLLAQVGLDAKWHNSVPQQIFQTIFMPKHTYGLPLPIKILVNPNLTIFQAARVVLTSNTWDLCSQESSAHYLACRSLKTVYFFQIFANMAPTV